MTLLRMLPALTLALSAAACTTRQEVDPEFAVPDSVYIEAINENFYDARVHAIYDGGQRRTLGTIAGNGGHTEMALAWEPRALVFEIAFIISGATYISLPRDVERGELLQLVVPSNISESGFFRRVRRN